eukprot:TRINITY_DN13734_c0_g1_i1.p1 TRINITY_DN13734_c0_g1~~TRINITY_DN13734_c0_g1_i1.p1  ORF type:complete len:750 (+),score=142.06 TRINITY_DN13734_c0_g1_i1:74-2251(+)
MTGGWYTARAPEPPSAPPTPPLLAAIERHRALGPPPPTPLLSCRVLPEWLLAQLPSPPSHRPTVQSYSAASEILRSSRAASAIRRARRPLEQVLPRDRARRRAAGYLTTRLRCERGGKRSDPALAVRHRVTGRPVLLMKGPRPTEGPDDGAEGRRSASPQGPQQSPWRRRFILPQNYAHHLRSLGPSAADLGVLPLQLHTSPVGSPRGGGGSPRRDPPKATSGAKRKHSAVPLLPMGIGQGAQEEPHGPVPLSPLVARAARQVERRRARKSGVELSPASLDDSENSQGSAPCPPTPGTFRKQVWAGEDAPIQIFLRGWPEPYQSSTTAGWRLDGLCSPTDRDLLLQAAVEGAAGIPCKRRDDLFFPPEPGSAQELREVEEMVCLKWQRPPRWALDSITGDILSNPIQVVIPSEVEGQPPDTLMLSEATYIEVSAIEKKVREEGPWHLPDFWREAPALRLCRAFPQHDTYDPPEELPHRIIDWVKLQRDRLQVVYTQRNRAADWVAHDLIDVAEAAIVDGVAARHMPQLLQIRRAAALYAAFEEQEHWRQRMLQSAAAFEEAAQQRRGLADRIRQARIKATGPVGGRRGGKGAAGKLAKASTSMAAKRTRELFEQADALAKECRSTFEAVKVLWEPAAQKLAEAFHIHQNPMHSDSIAAPLPEDVTTLCYLHREVDPAEVSAVLAAPIPDCDQIDDGGDPDNEDEDHKAAGVQNAVVALFRGAATR